jgi:trans-aconitate 2-methyltransferase
VARWDPERYGQFADERSRPFFDLLAAVDGSPGTVVDLGCGPGTLTASLADRWPAARVVGIDNSPEMLARARVLEQPGRLEFRLGDLERWEADGPVDLIVSNAALQWVPRHRALLPGLASQLTAGGTLAFQVPGNFAAPSHLVMAELCRTPRWRESLGDTIRDAPVAEPMDYLGELQSAGLEPRVWETTYLHVLAGEQPVLDWLKGTALRPVLARLDPDEQAAFCGELAPRLAEAYPGQAFGTVLPFRRIFAVGRRARP